MGWITDVAVGVLRGAGKKDLADWIKNAPAKLGEEVGRVLAGGLDSRGSLDQDAVAKLEKLQRENPLPGLAPPVDLEDEYAADLNALANLAAPLDAVVVRGFLHDAESLVVWIFARHQTTPLQAEPALFAPHQKEILLAGSGMRVLLLEPGSDDELVQANRDIERDATAFLTTVEGRYLHEVVKVTRNEVVLAPRRLSRSAKPADVSVPIRAADDIDQAFRTMPLAKAAQDERLSAYREAKARRGGSTR